MVKLGAGSPLIASFYLEGHKLTICRWPPSPIHCDSHVGDGAVKDQLRLAHEFVEGGRE